MADPDLQRQALALFEEALDQPDDTREAWLKGQCAGNQPLYERAAALLSADEDVERLLPTGRAVAAVGQTVPDTVGPYRITRLLGQGGMGAVYQAERRDGTFDRTVAVKFIRSGALSSSATARFNNERRIMASLQHPNIAQMLDGGMEGGLPYLVMEYVQGEPFRHDPSLPLKTVLQRFLGVCEAVDYAHRNLVLHRDIKPGNVLITQEGQPKLLDFGIAKLTQSMDEQVLDMTGFGQAPLTPAYTAPECLGGEPASVVTDVYALGVLLYEVVSGRRPHDLDGLTLPEAYQQLTMREAPGLDSGYRDLDLIAAVAMHRDPARRYGSARALAEDVQRFLERRPVQARGDDVWYVVRRFVARNRVSVATGLAALAILIASLVGTTFAYIESDRQRQIAEQQTATAESAVEFLTTALGASSPMAQGTIETTVAEALAFAEDRFDEVFAKDPQTKAYMLSALGGVFMGHGEFEKGLDYAERAVALVRDELGESYRHAAGIYGAYAGALWRANRSEEGRVAVDIAIRLFNQRAQPMWNQLIQAWSLKGAILSTLGLEADARLAFEEAVRLTETHDEEKTTNLASVYNGLALIDGMQGHFVEAERNMARAIAELERAEVEEPGNLLLAKANWAGMIGSLERFDEAEALYEEIMPELGRVFGEAHRTTLWAAGSWAVMYQRAGRVEDAIAVLEPYIPVVDAELPHVDETAAYVKAKLGYALCKGGRWEDGLALLQDSLAIRRILYPPENWTIADAESAVGFCQLKLGRLAAAEQSLQAAYALFQQSRGQEHASTRMTLGWLQELYETWGKPELAQQYQLPAAQPVNGF